MACTSAASLMPLSSISRMTAPNIAMMMPATTPMARFALIFGDDATLGSTGAWMTAKETFMPEPAIASACFFSCFTNSLTMRTVCFGLESVAEI